MNKHLKIGALALLMASVGVVGTASAFGAPRGGENAPTFEELDTNADGIVSLEELEAQSEAHFANLDSDGDGVISADEMSAMIEANLSGRAARGVERMIERFDDNGDGVLSEDELPQRNHSRMLENVDADEDGAISAEEFEAAKEKRGERGDHGGKRGGGAKGGRG